MKIQRTQKGRQTMSQSNGFTIIEVVLVLAIAGLIFMMVFIALPALQRSQRDTQRKSDLARALTAVSNYTSANRGKLPSGRTGVGSWATFVTNYIEVGGDEFIDPSGGAVPTESSYQLDFSNPPTLPVFSATGTQNRIFVSEQSKCGVDGTVTSGQGSRYVALRMALEGGGAICQNN